MSLSLVPILMEVAMRYLNGIWLDFQLLRGVWAIVDPRNLLQYHNLHNLQQV